MCTRCIQHDLYMSLSHMTNLPKDVCPILDISNITMRLLTTFLFLASILVVFTEAGFRCSIGEWACKASCVVTLQDSGETYITS